MDQNRSRLARVAVDKGVRIMVKNLFFLLKREAKNNMNYVVWQRM